MIYEDLNHMRMIEILMIKKRNRQKKETKNHYYADRCVHNERISSNDDTRMVKANQLLAKYN
jgi:hypothetical protein